MAEPEKKLAVHTRLIGLRFRDSVGAFGSEVISVSLMSQGSDGIDRIMPGRLTPDGIVPTAGNERADVMMFQKKRRDMGTGESYVDTAATSLENIKAYVFGK